MMLVLLLMDVFQFVKCFTPAIIFWQNPRRTCITPIQFFPASREDLFHSQARNSSNFLFKIKDSTYSRREAIGWSLSVVSCLLFPSESTASTPTMTSSWQPVPMNKRFGTKLQDFEDLFPIPFVTYLSRFLLNFDPGSQEYWKHQKQSDRLTVFAAYSASVEVGLRPYAAEHKKGVGELVDTLIARYGTPGTAKSKEQTREAQRQLALLFALLPLAVQPTERMMQLLAAVDNGMVVRVQLAHSVMGYEVAPNVTMPSPIVSQLSIEPSRPAQAVSDIMPTGKLLRVEVVSGGSGYVAAPMVYLRASPSCTTICPAKLQAIVKNGQIVSVKVLINGAGYTTKEPIVILGEQSYSKRTGYCVPAILQPIWEQQVTGITITEQGSGYAVEQSLQVLIDEPNPGKPPFVAGKAFVVAARDTQQPSHNEDEEPAIPLVGTSSSTCKPFFLAGAPTASSSQLLDLFPDGVGLAFNSSTETYRLALDATLQAAAANLNRPWNTDFGPRGRAPIERDRALTTSTLLRFAASGALCAGGVYGVLTPLDVVKTKVQTDVERYPTIGQAFSSVWKNEGRSKLFSGLLPTVLGNALSGAVLYALTELLRRVLAQEFPGVGEVPIIIASAAVAASIGAVIGCPFETVRIRCVAQPDYAPNAAKGLQRIVVEEGWNTLVDAVPVLLAKAIPYAMTKFLVFDLSTKILLERFPSASEDVVLSLWVTLAGGVLGGVAAACVSNPADAVVSELKKSTDKSSSPLDAAYRILDRSGVGGLFRGLPLRVAFCSLATSMQFVVYDSVRLALGVGTDDLKLYLDVLGDALKDST